MPLGQDLVGEIAAERRIESLRGQGRERVEFEDGFRKEPERALEIGLDGGGAERGADGADGLESFIGLGGLRGVGGGGGRGLGGGGGAEEEAARRRLGRAFEIEGVEQEGAEVGLAFLVALGPGEHKALGGAGAGDFEVEALFLLAVGADAHGEALLAEGEADFLLEDGVGRRAAGKFAFEQPADEDHGQLPLAGFLHVEDVDDIAAGIAGEDARFFEGILQAAPEIAEGKRLVPEQRCEGFGRVCYGAEDGRAEAEIVEQRF